MCLSFNKKSTEAFKKKIAKSGKETAYKVLRLRLNTKTKKVHIETPYIGNVVKMSKTGIVNSNRKDKTLTAKEIDENRVSSGIHVYLHKESANAGGTDFVVPVTVLAEDFIATNSSADHSVFKKIVIDKTALQTASAPSLAYLQEREDSDAQEEAGRVVRNAQYSLDTWESDVSYYKEELKETEKKLKSYKISLKEAETEAKKAAVLLKKVKEETKKTTPKPAAKLALDV